MLYQSILIGAGALLVLIAVTVFVARKRNSASCPTFSVFGGEDLAFLSGVKAGGVIEAFPGESGYASLLQAVRVSLGNVVVIAIGAEAIASSKSAQSVVIEISAIRAAILAMKKTPIILTIKQRQVWNGAQTPRVANKAARSVSDWLLYRSRRAGWKVVNMDEYLDDASAKEAVYAAVEKAVSEK